MHNFVEPNWSPQQAKFLDWAVNGTGSCVLEAVAGAGKTTVLLVAAVRMPGQVAVLSYNRDIADENKAKLIAMLGLEAWKKAQAGTVHSFGYTACRKFNPKVQVDDNKVFKLIEIELGNDQQHPMWAYRSECAQLVDLAKQTAIGISGHGSIDDTHLWLEMADHFDVFDWDDTQPPVNKVVELAQSILCKSNANTDVIDYADMCYLPLVHKMRMWQFHNVMIDEAQDTNAARRAMVRALLRKGGRVIAVGDTHQAIYGFTGADSDSLQLIAKDFNCIYLPLTITFRCPKTVVKFSQQWVSHIEAAETAPEGSTTSIAIDDFFQRNDLTGGSAVLSRTNKPLVALAFQLIRKRIPCRVEGRKIGEGIVKLMQRWKVSSLDALEKKLDNYLAQSTTRLLAAKKETKLAEIEDLVETVKVIIDQCRSEKKYTINDAVAYVDELFGDKVKSVLVLSSIHKAKGREWNTVFWLDRRNTCPSKWARQEWQQGQERNLCYVAATRSKDQLVEIVVPPPEKQH
jgi:DNA helicase II / ATP-dependent DNA helicase PcrA